MSVLHTIADILYPPACSVCGGKAEIHRTLCRDCYAKFIRETCETCPICGKIARICTCGCDFASHTKTNIAGKSSVTLTFYKSYRRFGVSDDGNRLTETMIYRLKEKCDFTKFFAAELAKELKKTYDSAGMDISGWTVTYAPRSMKNYDKYGFDQSAETARALARELKIPFKTTFVRDYGDEQKNLNAAERLENAEDSLIPQKRNIMKNGNYLLLDDIITSGATVMTISRNLYFHGAAEVFPVSIARTIPYADEVNKDDMF